MSFEVGADAYATFMGRFSTPLASLFVDAVGVAPGQSALDVGCGTGALTEVLVERLGLPQVSAVDPSQSFVAVMQERFPPMDVRRAAAESLPHDSATFDVTLAQLVVHFMTDPVAGIREMGRVTRPGGIVAATVWDFAGRTDPLAAFWAAVRSIDPQAPDESHRPGVREGHLAELFVHAGLDESTSTAITFEIRHDSFDHWWQPFTLGVGPAGAYVATLSDAGRDGLRERCRSMLPDGPFATSARAWTVWATVQAG